ncbi:hypothetical protein BRADI_1g01900v3 [Brachypodium distachyon]|uniref:Membrane insertase YidC/Oxa/ALB C-terminal domain-containing protein n=1 Tax=Brachypodium distachyon TaxID=15368 RepID=A0A2K2DHP8_BRADI|nr:hypothetical protein BRADI_1g01900v3 [Brachypodium distachyon]
MAAPLPHALLVPHRPLLPPSSSRRGPSSSSSSLVLLLARPARRGGAALVRPVAALGGGGDVGELFVRVEAFLYTVADAAVVAAAPAAEAAEGGAKEAAGDWLSGITGSMETVLKVLKDGLSTLHIPYSYGFAIILLTVLIKGATFPLTKKQVESALAMRSLQPQVKAIQERYAGDQERIQLETARLYKLSGVDPLAGCLPTLVTIPVWIGLYRALSNVANEGLLTEGFFWIPSLAGPTTIAARQSGQGISWLFPFTDGHPPLGWSDTLAYLVLPVLLVISQYVSAQIMQPSQSNDPSQQGAQAALKFLPLLIGYFALSVPSGLSLYWKIAAFLLVLGLQIMSLAVHSKCGFKSLGVPKILSKNILTSLQEMSQQMLTSVNLLSRLKVSQKLVNPRPVKYKSQVGRSAVKGLGNYWRKNQGEKGLRSNQNKQKRQA